MSKDIGSSPRVWGRCRRPPRWRCRRPVHPHACGADEPYARLPYVARNGSSPRVWGRSMKEMQRMSESIGSSPRVWGRCFHLAFGKFEIHRFIPTRVGQMISRRLYIGLAPRFIPTRVGQIFAYNEESNTVIRFIPTRVGQMQRRQQHPTDHFRFIPTRVGQMKRFDFYHQRGYKGSSPRVWGRWASAKSA